MFKITLPFIALLVTTAAAAGVCRVSGISDSPQAISCRFKETSIELRCDGGKYFINEFPVKAAFHFDVEEGPVPLVFDTESFRLVVEIDTDHRVKAILSSEQETKKGKCQLE